MDGVSSGVSSAEPDDGADDDNDLSEMTRAMREVVLVTERYRIHEARHVLGLSTSEMLTLGALSLEGPHTPGQIAARLQITTASATELIDRLERAALVARGRHPHDRRKVLIELTARGQDQTSLVQAPYAAALARCSATLAPDQHQLVLSFLRSATSEIRALVKPNPPRLKRPATRPTRAT